MRYRYPFPPSPPSPPHSRHQDKTRPRELGRANTYFTLACSTLQAIRRESRLKDRRRLNFTPIFLLREGGGFSVF